MSKLTKQEIDKISKLARIELEDSNKTELVSELGSILEFVDDLQSLDLKSVQPVSQVTNLQDIWREDVVVDCDIPREKFLSNAPDAQDGYFKVKKVL
ncbi:MAG TPA: Asp-tRNA(Asn)/Glu-tRNA(Gln) amidotransferase subunit GatC [Candidatus Saccharibacteria bacterium]|nr:Asp-tRNA(Asn)/Glu-tRNA(Gln) amidotransferase subunit GatC [Candidatus Saccharibacteria bacterium]HMT39807.1 Asp-tRNA(Asn)/Glu-tRNA(Gln) amidotransferase subunit GatC [Candidatus Saccharibacteria bacterium]